MIDGTKVHQVLGITKYLGKKFTLQYPVPSKLLIYAHFLFFDFQLINSFLENEKK